MIKNNHHKGTENTKGNSNTKRNMETPESSPLFNVRGKNYFRFLCELCVSVVK